MRSSVFVILRLDAIDDLCAKESDRINATVSQSNWKKIVKKIIKTYHASGTADYQKQKGSIPLYELTSSIRDLRRVNIEFIFLLKRIH